MSESESESESGDEVGGREGRVGEMEMEEVWW